jgi:uncharacterized protein YkwD
MAPGRSTRRARVRLRFLTAAAVTLACGLAISSSTAAASGRGCAGASTAATRESAAAARIAVECLINAVRAEYGLPALQDSRGLDRAAQRWVNRLVATDTFDHGDFPARLLAAGVSYAIAGEDLGTGQATPKQIVSAWMASADHCRNILTPLFDEIGVGKNRHAVPGYAAGSGTWAADFAARPGLRVGFANWRPANGCPY